jgi:hypothetical protein
MLQRARRYQESLHDEEIINDLYSDNLSDVSDDIFSESDIVNVHPLKEYWSTDPYSKFPFSAN